MKNTDNSLIKIDISGLAQITEKLIGDAEFINASIPRLIAFCDELDGMLSGESAAQIKADTLNVIDQIKELASICTKTAKEYDFALSVYKENKQKTADIINAIEI